MPSQVLEDLRELAARSRFLTQVLSFHTLAHSFALTKNSTLLFSTDSALFAKKNTGVGGMDVEEISPLQGQIHGKKLWDGRRVRGKGMSRRTDEAHSLKAVPQRGKKRRRGGWRASQDE